MRYPLTSMYRSDRLAPELRERAAERPIFRVRTNSGHDAWLVTGHALTRQVLEHPDLSLARTSRPGVPYQDFPDIPLAITGFGVLTSQAGLRAELLRAMGARGDVRADWLRETAEELLDTAVRGGPPMDLCRDFALPFTERTACRLLGVPLTDTLDLADAVSRDLTVAPPTDAGRAEAHEAAGLPMAAIQRQLLRWMRSPRLPSDSLVFRLRQINDQHRRLDDERLAGLLYVLAIGAVGNPAAFLSTAALLLLQRPALIRTLLDRPGLIPRAAEELLRRTVFFGDGVARTARRSLTLAGHTVRQDDLVLTNFDTACFDPAVFPEPDRIRLDRPPGPQPSFGYGPHRCPGRQLARAQAVAALQALVPHLARMRLAVEDHEIPWVLDTPVLRPAALPVTWP